MHIANNGINADERPYCLRECRTLSLPNFSLANMDGSEASTVINAQVSSVVLGHKDDLCSELFHCLGKTWGN